MEDKLEKRISLLESLVFYLGKVLYSQSPPHDQDYLDSVQKQYLEEISKLNKSAGEGDE